MKKRILMTALAGLAALQACNQEPDYKAVREEVIKVHDQLMADDEKLMTAKMKVDTLLLTGFAQLKAQQASLDTANIRAGLTQLNNRMATAADSMSHWMENFKTDMEGKSNAEAVAYFSNEKVKVHKLDSIYKALLSEADTYFKQLHVATGTAEAKHEHHMH